MIITYHDGACIKMSAGDTALVFGPVSKKSDDFKPTNFGADVAFVPLNHVDFNGVAEAQRGDRQPFAITGPGEYEVKDITAAGFATKSWWGNSAGRTLDDKTEERINTIYSVHMDGLSVLYLGVNGEEKLPGEVLEMDSPDVLILPVGDNGALTPAEAAKLAVKLEAKIIIPILTDEKNLKVFLKEAGAEGTKVVDKLTIKPRDLAGKEGEVVVLAA